MPDQLQTGKLFHKLMLKLGYEKYWIQGGDWGSIVGKYQALEHPNHVYGYHTNFPTGYPLPFNKGIIPSIWSVLVMLFPSFMLSEEDYVSFSKIRYFTDFLKGMGYFLLQATKPQTIGTVLHDTPVGLAAYFIEKFHSVSDCNGQLENSFTKDELLNNIMIYWDSGCITTSVNFYFEYFNSENNLSDLSMSYLTVPTAVIVFPMEISSPTKAIVQYYYNVQRWTIKSSGGHFAALEEPEELVKDIREFRKQLSQSTPD